MIENQPKVLEVIGSILSQVISKTLTMVVTAFPPGSSELHGLLLTDASVSVYTIQVVLVANPAADSFCAGKD